MSGDPMELDPMREALKKVAVTLKLARIPFALAGGYATWARGGPESAHDVDFFILERDAERALEACEKNGLRPHRPPEDWLVKVWDDESSPPVLVDLIHHPSNLEVTEDMLRHCEVREVASVYMPVLSATDILWTKLHSMTEHYCDFGAVLPVARALREQVDWDFLRKGAAENAYMEAFLYLLERLRIAPAPDTI